MQAKFVFVSGLCIVSLAPAVGFAQNGGTEPTLGSQYVHRLVDPGAVARSGVAAGLDQGMTNPYEWGGGMAGFGRRFASAFGTHLVRSSIHFGVSKLLHEELSYQRSGETGFGRRLKYALLSTVITRKTTTHKRTPAIGEVSGIFGGAFISRLWHPAAYHTAASGFSSAGIGFAAEAGMNMLHEFWPEIRHPHRRGGESIDSSPAAPDKSAGQLPASAEVASEF